MTNQQTDFQRYPTCTCGTPGQCPRDGHLNRIRCQSCGFPVPGTRAYDYELPMFVAVSAPWEESGTINLCDDCAVWADACGAVLS